MDALIPFLVAGLAAISILLIFYGIAGRPSVDPVQARLTQLGSMQAKNLEELELQQPVFERTIKPLMGRLSGTVARITSASFSQQTEKRLALAGNPGDMRTADWLGVKAVGVIVGMASSASRTNFFDAIENVPANVARRNCAMRTICSDCRSVSL